MHRRRARPIVPQLLLASCAGFTVLAPAAAHAFSVRGSAAITAAGAAHAASSPLTPPQSSAASSQTAASSPQVRDTSGSGVVEGTLSDSSGAPLAGVVVSAVPLGADIEVIASAPVETTDAQGHFRFALPPGVYAVGAQPSGELDASLEIAAALPGKPASLAFTAESGTPLVFHGRVTRPDGVAAAGASVYLQRREDGAAFLLRADAQGRFRCRAPRGTWRALAHDVEARSEWIDRHGPDDHALALVAAKDPLEAPPSAAIDELRERLAPAKDGDLGAAALAAAVGDARVVALGDSLRGTHEELALASNVFQRLVEQRGFTLLALDAPFGEIWKLDEFLKTGAGDAREFVRGISWEGWQVEELVELVTWMRAWNADASHAQKLSIAGLDPLHTIAAATVLQDYFPKVDPLMGTRFAHWFAPFRQVNDRGYPRYEALDEEARISLKFSIVDVSEMFPDVKDNYLEHSTEAEFEKARAHLLTIRQCEETLRLAGEGWTTRDRERHMATNLRNALERAGEGAKALVLARNSFVGVEGEAEFGSFGWWMREAFGAQYVPASVCVGGGSARLADGIAAASAGPEARAAVGIVTLGASDPRTLEGALAATGKDAGVLDLHALKPDGAAARWLAAERAQRSLDGAWRGDVASLRRTTPARQFQLLAWIRAVTPVRALPTPQPK